MKEPPATSRRRGMVLLEVVLAMALFALSAGVLLSGMNASLQALTRAERQTYAADLAHSVIAMLEAGIINPAEYVNSGPTSDYCPSFDWSWQMETQEITLEQAESSLVQVTVTVSHGPSGFTHRTVQWLPDRLAAAIEAESGAEGLDPDAWDFFESDEFWE